jgi:uncharacterized membrane protein HdeD (DUF308 family)
MNTTPFIDSIFHGRIRAASHRLFWLGLALVALGVTALIFPVISTLAATLFVGWMLLIFGSFTLAGSFSIHGTGPFFGALLLSLLSICSGVFLLFNPGAGAIALTLMVGALFMIEGAVEIFFAFEMRPHAGWVAMLLSAVASIALAVLIAAGWPPVSLIVLGVLIGVNFISTGFGYIIVSRGLKPLA